MTTDGVQVRARYDAEMRRGAQPEGPGAVVERAGQVVRHSAPGLGFNAVLWSDLTDQTADAAIAEQVAFFAGRGADEFEWKLYDHDGPADLGARLAAAGLVPEPPETLMVARVADLTARSADGGSPALPEGVTLVPVTDAAGVELMMAAHEAAFGESMPRLHHQVLTRLTEEPDTLAAVVAMAAGRPVSAARIEMPAGASFAGLWGGGTAPEWRGRGIYRALVAHRARIAADRGIRYLQVDASDQSRPILERLGFEVLGVTTPYVWTAA
ncbi:GNAT family N-acetyltransferase [Streptomyces sp. NPDC002054]|uniref:GNAT family N-acetyltransferase n=1 Tax=Streptomyces sp. NPDC002054 TaxID=3154663 RepID=UPI00332EF0A6